MDFGLHRLFRRRQAAWWTLVAGLALTAALGWKLHREAVELDRQRLALRVAEITSQLDSRIEKSEMLLHNLRDYLMLSGESRDAVFAQWCYENGLSINCRWLHGMIVATNRNKAEWRAQMPAAPDRWTEADWATFQDLAVKNPIECDIAMASSLTNTKQFLTDYDLRGAGLDSHWFSKIVRNSRLGMGKRQTVMLDASSNAIIGTVFLVPIYKPELADLVAKVTAAGRTKWNELALARWLHLAAVVVVPVDFKVLAQSVWSETPSDLGLELFSSTNQTAETWLNISEGAPRAADPEFKAYLTHRQTWPMYGMRFSIFFHTTPLFEAQSPRRLAKISMAAGAIMTLLATALVGVALRARNRQELLTEQIREARDALAAAQREREKFSRDLHDGTIQSLYAIQLGLGHTVEKLEAEPARARREFSAVRRDLDVVIAEIRQFITTEAEADKAVDLHSVLQALVQRARTGTTARIELQCDPGAGPRLTANHAVQLANIAREALSNSLRHAAPQRVEIALRSEPQAIVLRIADDGAGFDPGSPGRTGVGLASMASRVKEVGGTLDIQSSPGGGTRVIVRVPTGLDPGGSGDSQSAGDDDEA